MGSDKNSKAAIVDWLVTASFTLRDLGRFTSETALLREVCQQAETAEHLEALLESAERCHDEATATATLRRLEALYDVEGENEKIEELRKSRLRFFRNYRGDRPRIAGIMDEFTKNCFAPECVYLPLDPSRAREQLSEFQPEFLFIESAWNGNDGLWNKMVSALSEPLRETLSWCRESHVPSVFWNKEDPVHHETFMPVAQLCDFVFTTDIDCIASYKKRLGHEQVFLLPFAAQPQYHNPIVDISRKNAFNFAGSYYLRYPERQRDTEVIIDAVSALLPVEIYDRNFERDHPHYRFPERYKNMIIGSLPFSKIDKAYKGYRYGININTVKQSQTMFARRVYELLASNTVVVSNFSRALRLMFGDLVVSSDDSHQINNRLENLVTDEMTYRKFRLLGLRKVMSEHTYEARMTYIREKIHNAPVDSHKSRVALIAKASNATAAKSIVGAFNSQKYERKHLFLFCSDELSGNFGAGVSVYRDIDSLISAVIISLGRFELFGELHERDYYGPNYLTDLALAAHYSDAEGFGKGSHFVLGTDGPLLQCEGVQYNHIDTLPLRASLLVIKHCTYERLKRLLESPGDSVVSGFPLLALDEFNYCRGGEGDSAAAALCGDLDTPFKGAEVASLLEAAEQLPAANLRVSAKAAAFPVLSARQFYEGSLVAKSGSIKKKLRGKVLEVTRDVDTGSAGYLWMRKKLPREALNLASQSTILFEISHDFEQAGLVCEYYAADARKISHSILNSGGRHMLAIPEDCTQLRFGLRFSGCGTLAIGDITFGSDPLLPPLIISTSDTLVVTKQYPSYSDLYKYGFLHSRIRGYKAIGKSVDIFRINPESQKTFDEFENIDVASGDAELLSQTLRYGRYKHVLVHMLDRQMWEILKKHLDHLRVTIWIHGAEIQHWRRREYEFSEMTAEEIDRKKMRAEAYLKLWREVFAFETDNLKFVFVSESLKREAALDVGTSPAEKRCSVIHNYVDGTIFQFKKKNANDRLKIISIRPFSAKKYANDLTIGAIDELSKRSFFGELSFTIVGSGNRFSELTAPISHHPNVQLHERFLTQTEMAEWYEKHGVFLCPTRWDSQGVSRDEAMASGLVPVTNDIAAVPEFVDETCGLLAPPEDPVALADLIERLYRDADLFLRLSHAAASRVRAQSGFQMTLARELELFR